MALFDLAIPITLKHEGGYQCSPNDPGNWTSGHVGIGELKGTNYGISASTYPNEDIKNLTLDRAKQLYKQDWWKFDDVQDQHVANKVFDLAVNWQRYGGHGPAITVLQKAINSCGGNVVVDGSLGSKTIDAANALYHSADLLNAIRFMALQRYRAIEAAHPEESSFFTGWEARALE